MFGFLILGYGFLLYFVSYLYIENHINLNSSNSETFLKIVFTAAGLCLFVSFQLLFTCTVAPFILISLVYHRFFDRLLIFYGIGENGVF